MKMSSDRISVVSQEKNFPLNSSNKKPEVTKEASPFVFEAIFKLCSKAEEHLRDYTAFKPLFSNEKMKSTKIKLTWKKACIINIAETFTVRLNTEQFHTIKFFIFFHGYKVNLNQFT